MTPYKSHLATAVPEIFELRLEIMKAIRVFAAQEDDERLRQRRAELASARHELGEIALALHDLRRECDPRLRSYVMKYSPDQPRVPAGNSDGGQWTSEGGSDSSYDSPVISDATPDNMWIPGAQYAGGIEDDDDENRIGGKPLEATPAQQARLALAQARWQDAISQVQALDPNWKPTPGLYETVEGQIADLEAQAQEARNRLSELANFGIGRGPFAGESIPARGPGRNLSAGERTQNNENGSEYGCHTCGADDPGTLSGNWVGDHQPPSALNSIGNAQRIYPQCLICSLRQGGWITQYLRGRR